MPVEDRNPLWRDADFGTALVAEFTAAPLAWAGIGWLADTYVVNSFPWATIAGLITGFGLGTYLVYVRTTHHQPGDGPAAPDTSRGREEGP